MRKKVRFLENKTIFSHPIEFELDLRKYRSKYSTCWSPSLHRRFEKILAPVLDRKLRRKIPYRNLLAKEEFGISQIISSGMEIDKEGSPLDNLLVNNPGGAPVHWKWVNILPETTKVGFYCEHTAPISVRLTPYQEHVLFIHCTHTMLCLCALEQIRQVPGVALQFQVPPPYTLMSAQVTEVDFELFVMRRTQWEQGETPPCEIGYSRPPLLLTYNSDQYMLNHCAPTCQNFV